MSEERQMVTALRNKAAEVRNVNATTAKDDQTLRAAAELLRVMARLLEGMPTVKAFGAPGHWGYETELGQAVIALRQGTCAAGVTQNAKVEAKQTTCSYPHCNCPFDAPADPDWCARGLPHNA